MPGINPADFKTLIDTTFPNITKGFHETAGQRTYGVAGAVAMKGSQPFTGPTKQQTIRVGRAPSGTKRDAFEGYSSVGGDYSEKLKIEPLFYTNAHNQYDMKIEDLNSGQEAFASAQELRKSATHEAILTDLDADLSGLPSTEALIRKTWLGPRFWFPETPVGTSGVTGRFTGDTVTLLDGTALATRGGVNHSLPANGRLRTHQTNWSGTVNATVLKQIAKAQTDTKMPTVDGFVGTKPNPNAPVLFMASSVADDFRALVNAGYDDYEGKLYRFGDPPVSGLRIVRVSEWDDLATKPIILVNLAAFKLYVIGKSWMKKHPAQLVPNTHDIFFVPVDCHGQFMPDNPKYAGATLNVAR